jgi:hypothetical protein
MKTALSNKLFLCAAMAVGNLGDTMVQAQPGGVPLWTNRYDGPGNGDDGVNALAVDSSGNVFVTGSSWSGTSSDYVTIKYSNAGVPLWTNRYNGPGNSDVALAAAVDGSGNVLVTGSSWSGTSYDCVTIKYSGAGVPLWTNRNRNAAGIALAVESSGNVFVTGNCGTIKYSNAGVPLWTNLTAGVAIALDSSGSVFVTGSLYDGGILYHHGTIKYSGAGVPLWTNHYQGTDGNGYDQANAVAVDASGNTFVIGSSTDTNGYYDYVTIAYSSAGPPLWTNRYNGLGNGHDFAKAAVVDGSGNVFVTGLSSSGSSSDYVTIKYSNAGAPLWTNRYHYNGVQNNDDQATALAMDGSGNVFVTGNSYISNTFIIQSSSYATVAYSSGGVPLWTNRYQGTGDGRNEATAIAVDRYGNAFVTGHSWNGSSSDYVTIKYSSMGGPPLTIARTATNTLAVSWPAPAADFTLQENTNIASTNWSALSTTPADDGTNKTIIIDPPAGNRFYRLFHP